MKLLTLFFALATATLAAQSPERTLRIIYLNAPPDAPRELILYDGENAQKVRLPRMNFSPVYQLRPDVQAITLLNNAPESGQAVPPSAPRLSIPSSATDFYLFISTDLDNPVVPIRMNLAQINEDFKNGQMLWFNLTGKVIGGQIGNERIVIQPRSRHLMDAPARSASNYHVKLAFTRDNDEHVHPICETTWYHNPNSRNVAFIFSRPGMRTPRAMVFPDHR